MQRFLRWIFLFLESYIVVAFVALGVGILFPQQTLFLVPWITFLLQIIFFLSSLKIDLRSVKDVIREPWSLFIVNVYMLILLPLLVYGIAWLLIPTYATALMLLAAMPAAMSAPLFAEIVGLPASRALVLTTTTSLLTPFTVPFVVWLLVGATVHVDPLSMFWTLTKVILIPFICAQIVRAIWPRGIHATTVTFKPISILLLGLLIVGVVAQQADAMRSGLTGTLLPIIALLFAFFILLHYLGYVLLFRKPQQERLTVSLCLTYMNFTLAIYLAGRFFNTPDVVLPVILSVFPWTLLLIPFRVIARRSCPSCFVLDKG